MMRADSRGTTTGTGMPATGILRDGPAAKRSFGVVTIRRHAARTISLDFAFGRGKRTRRTI